MGLVGFTDYQWNQPTRITLPGGSVIQRQYDGLQRMASNTLLDPAQQALMTVVYGYDAVGNILNQSTDDGEYGYGYDNLYRLTSADYPDGQANDETFDYDGVGNRTSHNADTSWQYNDANQLTQQNNTTYEYNDNGHLTKKTENGQVNQYVYNAQERLVRVEDGNSQIIAEYGFNPFGHRVWKEVAGVRTYFFYNTSGLVGEYDATGALIKEYQYTPKNTWMTDPLLQRSNGQVYFYQTDHLGTPRKLLATSGEVVWAADYEAFGNATVTQETIVSNLRFPGQYYDFETGLNHNYFRDYMPVLGRYVELDPISIRGGVNGYAYVYSNPLYGKDPYGLLTIFDGYDNANNVNECMQEYNSNEEEIADFYLNETCANEANTPRDALTCDIGPRSMEITLRRLNEQHYDQCVIRCRLEEKEKLELEREERQREVDETVRRLQEILRRYREN